MAIHKQVRRRKDQHHPTEGRHRDHGVHRRQGRTTELRQYKDPAKVGSDSASTFDKTTYGFNIKGELAKVVDPGGNTWAYRYDVRGNQIAVDDPDSGTTTSTYDDAGQLLTTKDARGKVLAYTYDKLGRQTSLRKATTDGSKLAEWQYDTVATNGIGRLAKSIRYEYDSAGTASAYTTSIGSYNVDGQALSSTLTLPSTETGLCGFRGDEQVRLYPADAVPTQRPDRQGLDSRGCRPAAGNPDEHVPRTGPPRPAQRRLNGAGSQMYVHNVVYNQFDQILSRDVGEYDSRVTESYRYDEPTGRLSKYYALPTDKTYVYNQTYTYTDSGNVTSIKDAPEGGQPSETQCFTYDYRQRLTEAWTPTSLSCATAPTKAALGGPAPYWRSYTYDAAGNRKSETAHASTDITRTYTYPTSGGAPGSKPHAVTSVASVTGTAAAVTQKYAYDEAGNTTCRPIGTTANTCPSTGTKDTAGQALTWTDEGSQSTAADKSGTTSYVYDADGNRLIRRDPTGTTVYLPGGQEVRKPTSGTATATRYYSHGGETIGVRTKAGLNWLLNDHHGTSTAFVAAVGLVAPAGACCPSEKTAAPRPPRGPGTRDSLEEPRTTPA